jgi:hypothetical protein
MVYDHSEPFRHAAVLWRLTQPLRRIIGDEIQNSSVAKQ